MVIKMIKITESKYHVLDPRPIGPFTYKINLITNVTINQDIMFNVILISTLVPLKE